MFKFKSNKLFFGDANVVTNQLLSIPELIAIKRHGLLVVKYFELWLNIFEKCRWSDESCELNFGKKYSQVHQFTRVTILFEVIGSVKYVLENKICKIILKHFYKYRFLGKFD